MKSNGGVLSADEVVHQPITTSLSGPAAGALGAALIAQKAGFDKVLTCDGGGTSTDVSVVLDGEPTLTTEGTVGAYPSKIPMIDVVTVGAGGGSIAWVSPEGALKVGPHSAGADPGPLCYGKGGTEPTITDAHVMLGRIPPHLLGGEIPLDVEAARTGVEALAERLGLDFERCATGILEISAWNQANALRQVIGQARARRPRLHAHDLRRLRLAARLPPRRHPRPRRRRRPAEPGQRQRLRPAHRRRQERLRADAGRQAGRARPRRDREDLRRADRARPPRRSTRRASPREEHQFTRTVDLRYFGQAYEVRVTAPADAAVDDAYAARVAEAFHDEHRQLYGYDFRDDPTPAGRVGQPARHRRRPDHPPRAAGACRRPRATPPRSRTAPVARPARSASTPRTATSTPASGGAPTSRAGDTITGPAIIEEFGSTVPVHPGFVVRVDTFGNLVITKEDK